MDVEMDDKEKRLKEAQAQKDLDLVRAYKTVFNSADGRRVLYDLMRAASFLSPTYLSGSHAMAINEGRRSLLLDILTILEKKEEDILNLLHQSLNEEEEYEI